MRHGDHLLAAVMAVLTQLGDENPRPASLSLFIAATWIGRLRLVGKCLDTNEKYRTIGL